MANEAVCIEAPKIIVRRTVGGAITKGTILKLSDPNTAAASSAADVFAGIAVEEVTTADYTAGVTSVGVALDGVWDLTCNANAGVTAGSLVSLSGANLIKLAVEAEIITGAAFGKAEETASASEVIRVRLLGY